MIIDEYVKIKISFNNMTYWRERGYKFSNPAPRWKKCEEILVHVEHLPKKSCIQVSCQCDQCGKKYTNRIYRNTSTCNFCFASNKMKNNTHGKANKGKILLKMRGENHHAFNPNKTAFQHYRSRVQWLTEKTYQANKDLINPSDLPRTLCGVEGGYQLDHVVSVKEGFERDIDPNALANIENLQMLPWKDNLLKRNINT